MNVLDENILKDQRDKLLRWAIPIRQIGYEVGRKGMKDDEIIPFLFEFRRPTFFTLDGDLYKRRLCHRRYCIVFLDVAQDQAAFHIRRFLRHPEFRTYVQRMGTLIRLTSDLLAVWHLHAEKEVTLNWPDS
jgi:hypothetical protein